jgi:hypothetical protein
MKQTQIEEFVNKYVDNIDINLNTIIQETIANKNIIALPHDNLIDKILQLDSLKDIEEQITNSVLKEMNLDKYSKELITIRTKQVKPKRVVDKSDENIFDSDRLLDVLIDEIIITKDKIKLENFIGDLSNFQTEFIVSHFKYFELLGVIQKYLANNNNFLISNILNFFSKVVKCQDIHILTESFIVFLEYLYNNLDSFYKNNFDITKFYKLSFNIELLNNFTLAFNNLYFRRISEDKAYKVLDMLFRVLLKNYDSDFIYANKSQASNEILKNNYGISTNYIILLIFFFDADLSLLKILFKANIFRSFLLDNYEKVDYLVFTNKNELIKSFNTKNCFFWKHHSVLEQIFPKKKLTKKHLLYAWTSIRIHFLGNVVRYSSLKNRYLKMNDLSCSIVFENLLTFSFEVKSELDLDESLYNDLYYLIKEVLCDIILYCTNPECLKTKHSMLGKLKKNGDFLVKRLYDDLKLAFNNSCINKLNI